MEKERGWNWRKSKWAGKGEHCAECSVNWPVLQSILLEERPGRNMVGSGVRDVMEHSVASWLQSQP